MYPQFWGYVHVASWIMRDYNFLKKISPTRVYVPYGTFLVSILAERVGFEPTYRLITDNSISSRARYGLFATFPQTCVVHEDRPAGKPFFRGPAADGRPRAVSRRRCSKAPVRYRRSQTQQNAVRLTSIQPGSSRRVRSGAESSCAAADSPPRAEKKKTRFQKADPFSNVLQIGAVSRRNAAAAALRAEVCGARPCRRAAAL